MILLKEMGGVTRVSRARWLLQVGVSEISNLGSLPFDGVHWFEGKKPVLS